ncbi:hypothetical protein [Micromonospora rhizosphaerae]|uniref:hypothetical protein n=1 Tax=Micromonospora rhizosphaerae TaxID=568872 RepID=UPI003CCBD388
MDVITVAGSELGRGRGGARRAAQSLALLAADHQLIVCHGNGPQVGPLAQEPPRPSIPSTLTPSLACGSRPGRWHPRSRPASGSSGPPDTPLRSAPSATRPQFSPAQPGPP